MARAVRDVSKHAGRVGPNSVSVGKASTRDGKLERSVACAVLVLCNVHSFVFRTLALPDIAYAHDDLYVVLRSIHKVNLSPASASDRRQLKPL